MLDEDQSRKIKIGDNRDEVARNILDILDPIIGKWMEKCGGSIIDSCAGAVEKWFDEVLSYISELGRNFERQNEDIEAMIKKVDGNGF